MLHAQLIALLLALLACVTAGLTVELDLDPNSKWLHCIDDGRLNLRWTVVGSGKLHSGIQLPQQAQACKPSKPTGCKWLASCDASRDCSKFFPGELSGRSKCLVVINSSGSDSRHASIQLDLESAGNWAAIISGVVITSLSLVAVVAAGCYSDLRKLAAGDKRKRASKGRPGAAKAAADWQQQQQLPAPVANGTHAAAHDGAVHR